MRTVSCKLDNPTIERLTAVVETQGTTKAQFLKHLILENLNSHGKVEEHAAIGPPESSTSLAPGLRSEKTGSGAPLSPDRLSSAVNSHLPRRESTDPHSDSVPSSSGGQLVDHTTSQGRPSSSPKFIKGSLPAWLLFGALALCSQRSTSSTAVHRKPLLGLR